MRMREVTLEDAIQAFKEAISRYPHYAEPHYNLARIFYKRAKDQQKAVESAKLELKNPTKKMFFEEAIRLSIERAKENRKRAIEELKEAIRIDPSYKKAQELLATVQREMEE